MSVIQQPGSQAWEPGIEGKPGLRREARHTEKKGRGKAMSQQALEGIRK